MNGRDSFSLINGNFTDGRSGFIQDGALRIERGKIVWSGPSDDLPPFPDPPIDLGGRLVIPGMVNPHHHLYSTFATGLAPRGKTETFLQILENMWWHLDNNLDEESLYYSAVIGIMDAIRHGVTTIFDHHASMSFVSGSLSTIGRAFEKTGIRGLLCFETSDRHGDLEVRKHIDENLQFWEEHRSKDFVKGCFGLHANLTLSEETLEEITKVRPPEMPIHIHCGESMEDMDYCVELGYTGPVERLERHGLLDSRSLLIHAIHLSAEDRKIIRRISPVIVSNPESNANNRVGTLNRRETGPFILGTDGMGCDMIRTLRSHYLLGGEDRETPETLRKIFFDWSHEAERKFFPLEKGILPGCHADLAVLDYVPLSGISRDNLMFHLIFGAGSGKSWMTISRGQIIWHDGHFPFLDEEEILQDAKRSAKALHKRFNS
jgi:cytosine/adenosine deaminase-related metal-dependent hydrolase